MERIWPFDGTSKAGKTFGPVHKVVEIKDHCHIDGRVEKGVIWILDDNGWEFSWNLTVMGAKVSDTI